MELDRATGYPALERREVPGRLEAPSRSREPIARATQEVRKGFFESLKAGDRVFWERKNPETGGMESGNGFFVKQSGSHMHLRKGGAISPVSVGDRTWSLMDFNKGRRPRDFEVRD
ncbi:hypothetical protein HOG48_05545 [Candidatus Peregrinibacteria bacterium]|jgi:hypothetical protein|nr:hypothetical protein [Candidatus Peregrinibacteria bacterium]